MKPGRILPLVIGLASVSPLAAQEREDRTLLSQETMTAIINEVSGERAMHHVLELVPYHRIRAPEDYSEPYRESRVISDFAKAYGFSNVQTVVYQQGGTAWQPTRGELWMTSPKNVKLFDIHDIALSLASLNANGDLSAELVDVQAGRPEDFEGKDVRGKFVLSSGSTGATYAEAIQRGAIGVLGISAIGYQRAIDFPNQIVSSNVNAQPGTVALGQAAVHGLHRTLPESFHLFSPFAVLSGVGPHVRFVVYRSGDTFAFLFWRTLGFHGAGLAVPRCRPIVFQYATVLVGAEPLEGQGSVHRATVLVLFLVVGKTFYLRFVFPEDGYPPGDLPLFQKIVFGAVGIPCVRKEVRHRKLVLP
jgi:hypothetical protein